MEMQLIAPCHACKSIIMACPECVTSVRIDPTTGFPPDVARDEATGKPVNITPTAEAMARSTREPLCDTCAARMGATETAAERHRRTHAFG